MLAIFNDFMTICDDEYNADCDRSNHTGLQACTIVWAKVKDMLPEHVQEFARNIELLWKSKDNIDIDLVKQKVATSAMQATFNPVLKDSDELLDESVQNGSVDDDIHELIITQGAAVAQASFMWSVPGSDSHRVVLFGQS